MGTHIAIRSSYLYIKIFLHHIPQLYPTIVFSVPVNIRRAAGVVLDPNYDVTCNVIDKEVWMEL
jgi:hypothetical protein